jgi:hypothetical protein
MMRVRGRRRAGSTPSTPPAPSAAVDGAVVDAAAAAEEEEAEEEKGGGGADGARTGPGLPGGVEAVSAAEGGGGLTVQQQIGFHLLERSMLSLPAPLTLHPSHALEHRTLVPADTWHPLCTGSTNGEQSRSRNPQKPDVMINDHTMYAWRDENTRGAPVFEVVVALGLDRG